MAWASRSASRRLGILFVAALIALFVPPSTAGAPPAGKKKVVKVHRGKRGRVVVNVHRRPGYWRGVRIGAAVATLPPGHRRIVVHGSPYFFYDGAYYRAQASGYVVVAPPVGAVIEVVPAGCVPVKRGTATYHYCAGAFYSTAPGGFVVVEPPIGVTVDELPIGCEDIDELDGVEHYSCTGVFYRPVARGSETVYITVKP